MKNFRIQFSGVFLPIILIFWFGCISAQEDNDQIQNYEEMPDQVKELRTDAYKDQLENYLQDWIINGYDTRAKNAWERDYSSIDAFQRSVEPNRVRWGEILN